MHIPSKRPLHLVLAFAVGAVISIALYIYFYQFSALPTDQNDVVLGLISLVAPLASAICATLVFRTFSPQDKPRQVWLFLTIFIWLWTLAEFIWVGYLIRTSDVPLPSEADVFWLAGFVFLTIALRKQYELVTRRKLDLWKIAIIWALVFVLSLIVLLLVGSPLELGNYLEFFYAVADFTAGLAAIRIFLAFRGGLMSRPWIGLFVLGLSDSIYAWLIATDMYAMSHAEGNLLSLFADTTYMAAYLILAIGFYATYLMLKYGPENFVSLNLPQRD
jgi:hypothetical protein